MNEGPRISGPDLCIRLVSPRHGGKNQTNLKRLLVFVLVDFCGMPILKFPSRKPKWSTRLLSVKSRISGWVGLQVWSPGQNIFSGGAGKPVKSLLSQKLAEAGRGLPITGRPQRIGLPAQVSALPVMRKGSALNNLLSKTKHLSYLNWPPI